MRFPSIVALAVCLPLAAQADGVAWKKGPLAAALAEAKAQNRRVMVDVYATWCGPCHELDAKVFAREDVAKALSPIYVAVKVDGESGEGPDVVKAYNVVGYPTVLFLDADGREIDRVFGSAPPEEFVRTAEAYAKGDGTIEKAEEQYFAGTLFDARPAAELSQRWAVRGDLHRARFFRDEVERILMAHNDAVRGPRAPPAEWGDWHATGIARRKTGLERPRAEGHRLLRETDLAFAKYGLLRGRKDYAAAVKALQEIIRRHAGTDEADQARFQLAYAYDGLGRAKETKAALDAYLAAHDRKPGAYNAYAWFCFKQGVFVDEAIAVARKGLGIAPDDDGLHDTLAELLFKAGRTDEAIASEKRAIELSPDEPYYKSQLEKFSSKNTGKGG